MRAPRPHLFEDPFTTKQNIFGYWFVSDIGSRNGIERVNPLQDKPASLLMLAEIKLATKLFFSNHLLFF